MFQSVQFTSDDGLGKIAVAAFGIGFVMAIHVSLLFYYLLMIGTQGSDTWQCVAIWSVYIVALTFFHLAEFTLAAAFKPDVVSYECNMSPQMCFEPTNVCNLC